MTWVQGIELLSDQAVWLPADLAITPPVEGVLQDVDTNGVAGGNNLTEAVLHAVCEVIERDAVGQDLFVAWFGEQDGSGTPPRRIDPATVPATVRLWIDKIVAGGLAMALIDITSDIAIPTFKAIIADTSFPGSAGHQTRMFLGYGTDPCAEVAALRAVTEAVQSRLAIVHGGRDSFNRAPSAWRPAAWQSQLQAFQPGPRYPFDAVPTVESDDLGDELTTVLETLRAAGFAEAHAVDLTRADLGIPVVRVRVPGLTSFVANRRRMGWRCLRHLL